MKIEEQIKQYINTQKEPKRSEMQELHELILRIQPESKVWFTDGRNAEGKVVANPNIGYGMYTITYADGSTKEFYRIGLSANKIGISVYVLGLENKSYLSRTFGEAIGKASVTGYCIKFRSIEDIDLKVLEAAIRFGFES